MLYFIIALMMVFYILLNKFSSSINKEQKLEDISIVMFILNIILYILEGFLMVKNSLVVNFIHLSVQFGYTNARTGD